MGPPGCAHSGGSPRYMPRRTFTNANTSSGIATTAMMTIGHMSRP